MDGGTEWDSTAYQQVQEFVHPLQYECQHVDLPGEPQSKSGKMKVCTG